MTIGENLKRIRKEKGLTQVDFAKQIGVSRTYLSDLENDRKNVSTETLKTLSKKLGVSMLYLMEGKKTYRDLNETEKKELTNDLKVMMNNFTNSEKSKHKERIKNIDYNNFSFAGLKAIEGYITLVEEYNHNTEILPLLATIPDFLLIYGMNDYPINERENIKQDLLLSFEDLLDKLDKTNLNNLD